jgi:hypothetical protein
MNTQQAIDECLSESTDESRLIELISSDQSIVRGNAIMALARRVPRDEMGVITALQRGAASKSSLTILIGTMSEKMLAAAALKTIGTPAALEAFQSIFDTFSPSEQEDLVWNIKSNPLRAQPPL